MVAVAEPAFSHVFACSLNRDAKKERRERKDKPRREEDDSRGPSLIRGKIWCLLFLPLVHN